MTKLFSLGLGVWLILPLLTACSGAEVPLALGTLERDRLTLIATAGEIIVEQPFKQGSTVHQGDVIMQLDTTRQRSAVAHAQADIDAQSALLEKLRNGSRPEEFDAATAHVDSASATLKLSEQNLTRVESLVARHTAPEADLDNARAQRDSNAANLRDAQAQLALLRAGTRTEDLQQAAAQLQALQAALAGEQLKLDELTLRAPRDAVLDSLPWKTGERVSAGAAVAVLLSAGAPYARVYVPETRRANLSVGATVQVLVDGTPAPFSGTIRWIALDPAFTPYYALNRSERTRLVYLTEITLPVGADTLSPGLPAQLVLP